MDGDRARKNDRDVVTCSSVQPPQSATPRIGVVQPGKGMGTADGLDLQGRKMALAKGIEAGLHPITSIELMP